MLQSHCCNFLVINQVCLWFYNGIFFYIEKKMIGSYDYGKYILEQRLYWASAIGMSILETRWKFCEQQNWPIKSHNIYSIGSIYLLFLHFKSDLCYFTTSATKYICRSNHSKIFPNFQLFYIYFFGHILNYMIM